MFYSFIFFLFKQKTAYEMRISDWSSDVCSSDLTPDFAKIYAGIDRHGQAGSHQRRQFIAGNADAKIHDEHHDGQGNALHQFHIPTRQSAWPLAFRGSRYSQTQAHYRSSATPKQQQHDVQSSPFPHDKPIPKKTTTI